MVRSLHGTLRRQPGRDCRWPKPDGGLRLRTASAGEARESAEEKHMSLGRTPRVHRQCMLHAGERACGAGSASQTVGVARGVERSCRTTRPPLERSAPTRWLVYALHLSSLDWESKVGELICFFLSFCTHHKPAVAHQGVYANALDVSFAKRMEFVESMVSCSYLQCDITMAGHPLPARMVLHHGFEWRQELAYSRNRSSPGRTAAHHDVRGSVTPDIWPRRGLEMASAC